MMDILKILLLSLTQGITEILPISSSGHLLIMGEFVQISVSTLLLTTLHMGTTVAILFFFRNTVLKNLFSRNNRALLFKILIATIPAGIMGILFQNIIENKLRATWITAISLIFWGIVMILIERKRVETKKDLNSISTRQALVIGIAQSIALIPGTSRSGITTIAGIAVGLDKYLAFEFGLIIGIPVMLGSSVFSITKEVVIDQGGGYGIQNINLVTLLAILFVPLIFSYLSLLFVSKIRREKWLTFFGYYRIVVGILILLLKYGS